MSHLSILVAEDNAVVAEDLRQTLVGMGHDVPAVVHTGEDAARAARAGRVQLALLDIRMPGPVDGIDVGRRLSAELEIPVIYVTAYADDETVRRAKEVEPLAYLVKPVEPRELRTAIEIAVVRHRLEARLREAARKARKARDALKSSEERYRTLFEASPEPILIAEERDGRIVDVNRRFEELYGWTREEATGRTAGELGLLPRSGDRARLKEEVRSQGSVREFRTTCRTRWGMSREVEISAERLQLQDEPCVLVVTRDVTEKVAFQADLERMALYDTLTGLPNRNLFRDRLEHALDRGRREDREVGLLFIDLDRFKVVNDSLGHDAGDEVLSRVGQRIGSCFRDEDTVARLGGDEFAVVLENASDVRDAETAARRVLSVLEPPFEIGETEVRLGASVGIALGRGGQLTRQDLLRFSDVAMYAAKRSGGNQWRVFDAARDTEATRRLHLENELRRAVQTDDELFLRYQPLVALDTGRVVGAEALVRWDHPDRGLLLPDDFVHLAEDAGLVIPLGVQVVRQACRQVRRWGERLAPEFFVTVNLSPLHLAHSRVADDVTGALTDHGVDPGGLAVEITEAAVLRGPRGLRALRGAGVRVAIDDFGTGHSSLAYLKDLDVDLLKIDRSFVAGLDGESRADRLIVRAVLLFARGMEMEVVAEGIETTEQRDVLLELGCPLGQGFLFAEPMGPEDFLAYLDPIREGGSGPHSPA